MNGASEGGLTRVRAGQTAVVRFEVRSPAPYARLFGFAAEARS